MAVSAAACRCWLRPASFCSSASSSVALVLSVSWCSSASAVPGGLGPSFGPDRRLRPRPVAGFAGAPGCPGFGSSGELPASRYRWHIGGLTIHSSRTRFAASLRCLVAATIPVHSPRFAGRLNSGVMRHGESYALSDNSSSGYRCWRILCIRTYGD